MKRSLLSILQNKKELRSDIKKQIDKLGKGFDVAGINKMSKGLDPSILYETAEEKSKVRKLKSLGIRLRKLDKTINKMTEDLKEKTKLDEGKKTKLKNLSARGRRRGFRAISGGGGMMTTFKKGKSLIEKMKDL